MLIAAIYYLALTAFALPMPIANGAAVHHSRHANTRNRHSPRSDDGTNIGFPESPQSQSRAPSMTIGDDEHWTIPAIYDRPVKSPEPATPADAIDLAFRQLEAFALQLGRMRPIDSALPMHPGTTVTAPPSRVSRGLPSSRPSAEGTRLSTSASRRVAGAGAQSTPSFLRRQLARARNAMRSRPSEPATRARSSRNE